MCADVKASPLHIRTVMPQESVVQNVLDAYVCASLESSYILIMILIIFYFFLGCIPWPCFDLLGKEDPKICQHYVQAPNDVKVEFLQEPDPKSDTIVVSWKPSYYGVFIWIRNFLSI